MRLIHTLLIMAWTIVATAFFGIIIIIVSFFYKDGHLIHKLLRIWSKSILWISCIKVTVKGISNIDPAKSYIYMCNHQSNFDIPVLLAYLPAESKWLAKAELFKIPVFGYAMKRAGYISIDRSNRKSAFESLKRASRIIREGVSVLIFPEGTRSKDGSIIEFKKGGFVLAVDSGVPVIPIIIHGTRAIMPKKQMIIKSGGVILEIREPIETSLYSRKTKDKLLQKVREVICESFEKGVKD